MLKVSYKEIKKLIKNLRKVSAKLESFGIEASEDSMQYELELFGNLFPENEEAWTEEILKKHLGVIPGKYAVTNAHETLAKFHPLENQRFNEFIFLDDYNFIINFLPKTEVYQVLVTVEVF